MTELVMIIPHLTYVIRTGNLWNSTSHMGTGYSGHGAALNDPASTHLVGVGPIPVGSYTIGPPHTPEDHLGPVAMPLLPDPGNEMCHRSGFFMHGDNAMMNHTASNGCLIFSLVVRKLVNLRWSRIIHVVAEEKDR